MKVRGFLWRYRTLLATAKAVAAGLAAAGLLWLLLWWPKAVLYLLDTTSPISQAIKDFLWNLFPYESPKWIRRVGGWLGGATRWTLAQAKAREEAVGRMVLLDGFILWSLMTWVFYKILGYWVNWRVARWFNRRYVIVRRLDEVPPAAEEAPPERREPTFDTPPTPRLPHISAGPQVGPPRDDRT